MKCTVINRKEWVTKLVGVAGTDLKIESGQYEDAECNGEMIEVGGIGIIDKSGNPNSYEQKLYQCESCGRCKLV